MSVVREHGTAEHSVLFAESEDELAGVAGRLLARCLAGGGSAIALATAAHARGLDHAMRADGIDPTTARHEGSLVVLDAAETLDRLSPAGTFDLTAFDEVIGSLVRGAAGRGPVQAFGELVGLLWDQGRVQEAIELEAAWNGLLEETGAALVCAYPSMSLDAEAAPDVRAVCALHTSMLDHEPFERTWTFPPTVAVVSEARRLVMTALRARGLAGVVLADTEIVVAELMANAVLHGRSAFSITTRLDARRVRVEVADDSSDLPVVREMRDDADSGRGLHLLRALADRWGIEERDPGKVVWTELAR